MKSVDLILGLLLVVSATASLRVDPNEQCNWRGYKTCPIESSGSSPICDATNPT